MIVKISTIEEEFEKAQVKGFIRTRRGKMERVKGYNRSQAEKYFLSQPRGFLGSGFPVTKKDIKLVDDKVSGKVWVNEATGEVILAKDKKKRRGITKQKESAFIPKNPSGSLTQSSDRWLDRYRDNLD